MSRSTYDTDILEWSEQQAAALRDLSRTPQGRSNELDLEHVAEEIEDVGRSELMAVQSFVRQILVHVVKAVSAPDATSVLHWRKEVVGFHNDLLDRMTPSMPARINVSKLWQRAMRQAEADLAVYGQALASGLPQECPFTIAEITASDFDFMSAVDVLCQRIAAASDRN